MKRSDEKIGKIKVENKESHLKERKTGVWALIIILSLTGCEKAWHGHDGRPGNAYLSLAWQVAEPTYIDAGTGSIPPVFFWGEYYRISPGHYYIFYEGRMWNGMYWSWYAWQVEYDIWVNPGEPGDWYYNGADGPDNFFTIECNPYGPYIYHDYKNSGETADEIVITKKGDGYELRATYRKAEPKKMNPQDTVEEANRR
ncbi:MAG: hypothetical protein JXA03_09700 [Bacteroidales bacterium]|nr:hypothetical protein [Bacteroidales bacterium]